MAMVIRRCLIALALLANTGAAFAQDEPLARGKLLVFLRCRGCHTLIDPAAAVAKLGPNLHDLFGRKPGSLANYEYSDAMVTFGQDKVWNKATLTKFLHDGPLNVVPGTKMEVIGIKSDEEVQLVIAYLATFDPEGMAAE
jgi:cytochrome c